MGVESRKYGTDTEKAGRLQGDTEKRLEGTQKNLRRDPEGTHGGPGASERVCPAQS